MKTTIAYKSRPDFNEWSHYIRKELKSTQKNLLISDEMRIQKMVDEIHSGNIKDIKGKVK